MDLVEENYNNSKISDIISNILTLRYASSQNSSIPELTWKDFIPTDNKISEVIIEDKILMIQLPLFLFLSVVVLIHL